MSEDKPYRLAPQVADALLELKGDFAYLFALEQMAESSSQETKAMWRSVLNEMDKLKNQGEASC